MNEAQRLAVMQAHVDSAEKYLELPADVRNRPSDSYWELATPTFMENWPSDLYTLSIASSACPLSLEAARALGSYILELGECFDNVPEDREDLRRAMITTLDRLIRQYPRGVFVRLGSRSPKDAMYWGVNPNDPVNGEIKTGEQAFNLLTACSERICDDLLMQLAMKYKPVIWVREGLNIPEWSEFRCFMKDRRLIGISQYYYSRVCPEIVSNAESIRWAIGQFFDNEFRDASHLDSVVFDVFIKRLQVHDSVSYQVKLLEINPFFHMCDPCLFNWNKTEMFEGQLRYRVELGGHSQGVVNTSCAG